MTPPAADIDRIMTVMAAAFDPAYGEAWNRRQLEDALLLGNCHYFLANARCQSATGSDMAVGFLLSRLTLDEEELLLLGVMPQYRRMGIGSFMLRTLFSAAAARGARRIFLEMRRNNPAEHLYRNHGFVPIGIRPDYYRCADGRYLDAITFERIIR
ncbi:MAG: GNAT family N-acetyltransferase [Novosphingobium sp.]|nr:GNAT family N-acetyltransferase [Novosphingobium sp.]